VVAVSPDYPEYVKFADTWLPAKAGSDGALAAQKKRPRGILSVILTAAEFA
jgi:nitrate reductase alpha subunit